MKKNCSSFVMQSFIQISRQKMWDVIFELKTIKSNRYLVLLHLKPDMASRSCSRPESSRVRDGNIFLLLGNNGPTAFQRCVDREDGKEFLNNKFSLNLRFGFYICSFTKWQLKLLNTISFNADLAKARHGSSQ